MLFRQQVKTVTHLVELPTFVQDRISDAWGTRLPGSLTARGGTAPKVRGRRRVRHMSLGKTELTVLPHDMFTDLYAAMATLWKVEVTASNV